MSDQDPTTPMPQPEHHGQHDGRHEAARPKGSGPWRPLAIILGILLLLAIIGLLLWIFVFSKGGGGTPTNTPTQTPTTTPTQTVSPPPLATCTAEQLVLELGDGEPAAGSTTVPIVFGNTGTECVLSGYPSVSFIWEDGSVVGAPSTDDTTTPATQFTLFAGNEAANAIMTIEQAGNVCDDPLSTIGFRVTLEGVSAPIDISNSEYQACEDASISLLKVGPIGPGGSG